MAPKPGKVGLTVQLPEDTVREVAAKELQVAVMQALTRDPEALVRSVVNAAMSYKANSYDRETVFEVQVNAMIREAAKETMREWLVENKALIRAALRKRFERDGGPFVEQVADKIVTGLAESFYVTAQLKVTDN